MSAFDDLIGEFKDELPSAFVDALVGALAPPKPLAFCTNCFKVEAKALGRSKDKPDYWVYECKACKYRLLLKAVSAS